MRTSAAVFEQVGGKRVSEGVAGGALGDAGCGNRLLDGALDRGLVQVMPEAAA